MSVTLTSAAVAPAARAHRNDQIRAFYPMVRNIAQRIHARLPRSVELDDLVAAGVEGLIEAIDRYDEARSVPFPIYARHRVNGAILDTLRAQDWVPRSVRRSAQRLGRVRAGLAEELGREPTRSEMAAALGVTEDRYDALAAGSAIRTLVSLDEPTGDEEGHPSRDRIAAEDEPVVERWERAELEQLCVRAIAELPERERTTISLYYLRELSLKEIGKVLGVTESRACQLRSAGVHRLRARLGAALG